MSMKYKTSSEVPNAELVKRLNELSQAITNGRNSILREFDMRIPAEVDRDADLILSEAAQRITELEQQLALSKQVKSCKFHAGDTCGNIARAEAAEGIINKIEGLLDECEEYITFAEGGEPISNQVLLAKLREYGR